MLSRNLFNLLLGGSLAWSAQAAEIGSSTPKKEDRKPFPVVQEASNEGLVNIKKFQYDPAFHVDLVAAEPMLANPVAFCIDWQGRFLTSETYRYRSSVLDIRHYMFMLEDDLAIRTVEDRIAMNRKHFGEKWKDLAIESEVVRIIEDTDGDHKADKSTVYADGFNTELDGIASGVMARNGKVYFTNIPNLWEMEDRNGDGRAEVRRSMSFGYGVRYSYTGHDMHGLAMGPDGRLYFSFGDRGANVKTKEGHTLDFPDEGAVFRCELDGSNLEWVHKGLRNPQELAFDDFGNLFTGDNDCDNGDRERWVYVVEGGESGWRVGYQHAPLGRAGQWMSEKLWVPEFRGQAAYLVPCISNINDGPSGLVAYPGVGLPKSFDGHFFLTHFKGTAARSGITTFSVKPQGAGFELVGMRDFITQCLPTDVDFGYDGSMYFADWHHDWPKSSRGRIYRVHHPETSETAITRQVSELFKAGFEKRGTAELSKLLTHADRRVRQEAQFALAARGESGALKAAAAQTDHRLARLHGIWGLGQLGRKDVTQVTPLVALLTDSDAEVRAQAAKTLGDVRHAGATASLVTALQDTSARVRFFAAIALGRIGDPSVAPAILSMIRSNNDQDVYLRHAGVIALAYLKDLAILKTASKDAVPAVRMASLLALRRLEDPSLADFLNDADPLIVLEAARAINDVPVDPAIGALAAKAIDKNTLARLNDVGKDLPDLVTPFMLRAVNANYRSGGKAQAQRLAQLAGNQDALSIARREALVALGQWEQPPARDRIMGVYRPLASRDATPAREALQASLGGILKQADGEVLVAAIEAAASLGLKDASLAIAQVLNRRETAPEARVAALKALETLQAGELTDAVEIASKDSHENVRKEATRLQSAMRPGNATEPLILALNKGSMGEKQGALANLASLGTPEADRVIAEWMRKLMDGKAPAELALDILSAAEASKRPNLVKLVTRYQEAKSKEDELAPYRELLLGGDAQRGKKIFYEKVEASCIRCHKIQGEGGDVGPPQDGIGKKYNREYLLESIVLPNKKVAPGYETLVLFLKNGTDVTGILKEETPTHLTILSPEDGPVKVAKADIKQQEKGMSGMPAALAQMLTRQDLRDLVEYLASLK